MDHRITVVTEIRDLESEAGWGRSEKTGRARTACTCGLDTGITGVQEAIDVGRGHVYEGPVPRPFTFTTRLEAADETLAETTRAALPGE
ncbi:hypothetical protein [Streptomyces antarcticus]|uniref:hypothetical protein n=1 Tax=Streptomyces antarcticus TaxID=2996458 RepID=UPI00226D7F08|nr:MULTISPECIES: hypothetical protein [unclassified Streptomyces]MCY0943549.1 hypothetical protein [Streptomyces sp. H34-AA3]MCZ4083542.1 hypothetical protein [Streptomyces sp. H34-S5]